MSPAAVSAPWSREGAITSPVVVRGRERKDCGLFHFVDPIRSWAARVEILADEASLRAKRERGAAVSRTDIDCSDSHFPSPSA